MNWSAHFRSLDRMITLLAILGFVAGGAFLFVSYFAGPTLERGFLTVRHRPHNLEPVKVPEELPKPRPSASINPTSIKSPPDEEANRRQSSAPVRFSAEAAKVKPSEPLSQEVPALVLPDEPEACK